MSVQAKWWTRGESNPCPKHHHPSELRGLPEAHRRVSSPLVTVTAPCRSSFPDRLPVRRFTAGLVHARLESTALHPDATGSIAPGPQSGREGLAEVVSVVGTYFAGPIGETTPATPFRTPTPRRNHYGPKKCATFGTPPEPRTVPTYDSDGIAVRIPAPSIPDQGPEVRRRQDLNLRPTFAGDSLARSWFKPLTHVSKLLVNGGSEQIRTVGGL